MDIQIVKGGIPYNKLESLWLTLEEKGQIRNSLLKAGYGNEKYILVRREELKKALHSTARTELCTHFLTRILTRELNLDVYVGRTTIEKMPYYYISLKN
jgi:hypothetical protein